MKVIYTLCVELFMIEISTHTCIKLIILIGMNAEIDCSSSSSIWSIKYLITTIIRREASVVRAIFIVSFCVIVPKHFQVHILIQKKKQEKKI